MSPLQNADANKEKLAWRKPGWFIDEARTRFLTRSLPPDASESRSQMLAWGGRLGTGQDEKLEVAIQCLQLAEAQIRSDGSPLPRVPDQWPGIPQANPADFVAELRKNSKNADRPVTLPVVGVISLQGYIPSLQLEWFPAADKPPTADALTVAPHPSLWLSDLDNSLLDSITSAAQWALLDARSFTKRPWDSVESGGMLRWNLIFDAARFNAASAFMKRLEGPSLGLAVVVGCGLLRTGNFLPSFSVVFSAGVRDGILEQVEYDEFGGPKWNAVSQSHHGMLVVAAAGKPDPEERVDARNKIWCPVDSVAAAFEQLTRDAKYEAQVRTAVSTVFAKPRKLFESLETAYIGLPIQKESKPTRSDKSGTAGDFRTKQAGQNDKSQTEPGIPRALCTNTAS